MSNTGNQPPGGTPPASKPGDDPPPSSQSGADAKPASTPAPADPSQTPPASSPALDSSPPPASTPAPAPPDSAPASAPASAPDSNADSKPPDSSPPASDASPPSSQAPDSKPPDSDGCAEIPTASHVVLQAAIKLLVQVPFATDEASQLPHKLTLTNDDGSYSKTLSLGSDCQPGDVDGTSVITFEDLTEDHTYSLHCDDGSSTYPLFESHSYDELDQKLAAPAEAASTSTTGQPDPSWDSLDPDGTSADSGAAGNDASDPDNGAASGGNQGSDPPGGS